MKLVLSVKSFPTSAWASKLPAVTRECYDNTGQRKQRSVPKKTAAGDPRVTGGSTSHQNGRVQTMPYPSMAFATFTNPPMLEPFT